MNRRTLLGGAAAAVGAGLVWGTPGTAVAGQRGAPIGQQAVDAEAARLEKELVALRRDIHAHPEAPGQEQRTASVVARRLRAAGLDVTTGVGGGHGVVGVLRGARPGRTVAYRADMDAVPPGDIRGGGTAAAHVCGHDLHTTMGIGIAQVLARLRHRLSGTVVFLFQPAEESLAGARAMIDAGALARHGVEEIHALHCGPFPVGQFAVTPGTGLPGQDHAQITVRTQDDARQLAADLGALATVQPPGTTAELEQLVTDIQTPDGPLARFVAVRATAQDTGVRVSSRCWPPEDYARVRGEVRRLARARAGSEVTYPGAPFPAMVCPERDADALARRLRRTLGRNAVTTLQAAIPFSGEDFSLYLQRVPGTFTFLGVRAPGASVTTAYPHYPDFAPDERAIALGVRGMAGWLAERTRG
ncbi:M20/M25/M40 family metallo-hydrolase [Streptomyces sp. UNOC14_S4]|nr:M20/M25/M40 family metallo-hydrolase [Streptomyces sp. UNOC14_S4]